MINRKAYFEYEILTEYVSGIVLTGSEVKSIRSGLSNINDSYCVMINDELFIRNMYIGKYEKDNSPNDETRRDRKLLLTRSELKKIKNKLIDKGITIIPLSLNVDKLVKVKIGLGRGKKMWDKRESIKDRENKIKLKRMKL